MSAQAEEFQWPTETRSFCAEMPFSDQTALFEYGKGIHLFDAQGRSYLDSLSGVFVACFGYDCEPIISAMTEQLQKLTFMPPLHGTNRNALGLADGLVKLAPEGISSVKLLSGGSEAVECAIRLSRLFHTLQGNRSKQKILSNYQSYHGATYGSLALTGHPAVGIFGAAMPAVVHTWPPEAVGEHWNLDMPAASEQAAMMVERTVEAEGPDTIAALIVEPMSGVRAMATPDSLYFQRLREICDKHDILLIFDEIVTGFGRTGTPFAAQGVGVTPDFICAGKGISGGYAPLSALLIGEKIAAMFREGDKPMAFGPTHTYSGNPLAAAAGLAAVTHFTEGEFLPRIQELGARLQSEVAGIVGDRGEVNGRGLLCGIKFPDPEGRGVGDLVEHACLRRGVIMRGMIDGLMIAPPFITTDTELDDILGVLSDSIDEVVGAA
ncbi:MAG TPA: aminotransferase class III-fold pyridoxal phosphate-dependent enzyme [Actinophytocola sp.]|nr:aminotransferase class III-fold pyridoxal phosphate-dependent enzyme [Actinophytocola sp.]